MDLEIVDSLNWTDGEIVTNGNWVILKAALRHLRFNLICHFDVLVEESKQ